jgi:hypothetical protein
VELGRIGVWPWQPGVAQWVRREMTVPVVMNPIPAGCAASSRERLR